MARAGWRIIDTGPREPYTNMAFDEALLRGYLFRGSAPTLRVYGWEPAGFSIGCSQDARRDLDIARCHAASTPFVRRITGGGIIAHGNELTYSLVCSKNDLDIPEGIAHSYRTICRFLLAFYKRLGLDAAFACDVAVPGEKFGIPSAFCFASKEKYDIVVKGGKIGGSAQRRSRDVIFQHGSIPFGQLEELLGMPVKAAELSKLLVESFIATFGVTAEDGQLSGPEADLLEDLLARKYKTDEWNLDRIDITEVRDGDPYSAALVGR